MSDADRCGLAYVISRYTYQSTFIVREIEGLAARGWKIAVISLLPPVFEPGSDPAELPFEVRYDRHISLRLLGGALQEVARHPGVVFDYVRLVTKAYYRKPFTLVRNLGIVPKAAFYSAVARQAQWQHLHAHWATVSTSAAMLIARLSGLSFSFTGHAWDIFGDTTLLAEKAAAARFVLTCTEFNRQYLVNVATLPKDKVHVLYHGFPLQGSPSAPRHGDESMRILTVGRWSEKKGFVELAAALAIAQKHGVGFTLTVIAGGGSEAYERRVRQDIRELGLAGRTEILPWLPHRQILAVMRASDLFVLPCVRPANGAMDGIPNVLVEALSVGLPVVATRLSGIPELVRHGETGLLVDERDIPGLAAAVEWCAANRAEARELAAVGQRLVRRMFDIDHTTSMLDARFASTLSGAGTGGESATRC